VVSAASGTSYALHQPGQSVIKALAALAALTGASLACAESAYAPTTVGASGGTVTAIEHWQMQSSA
jgi:hypothetical protein